MKNINKYAAWLIPGLQVKRWIVLTILGTILLILGILFVFNLEPIYAIVDFLKSTFRLINAQIAGAIFLVCGVVALYLGSKKMNVSILDAISPQDSEFILENLYKRRKLNRGPKIVAIGGGTGLSTILKGLKTITNNLTAVVTVGDDGGSSGRLRDEFGVLPPGDIRNCIAALGDEDSAIHDLFQYRFRKGTGLEGHSFGNLFLSVLCEITGDMFNAVKESSKVLAIRGRVLPSTLDDMRLSAELEDGRIVNGESNIPEACGKIKRLFCEPESPKALKEVIDALKDADIILMGPGSLYTSVMPNLLIDEISKTISKSKAHKAYVCNVMTQPGETDNYTVSDHVKAILKHAKYENIIDTVFINNELPENLADKYEQAGSFPVKYDKEELKKLNIKVIGRKLIEEDKDGFVRHSYVRLARLIYMWYRYGYDNKKVSTKFKKGK
ncbi:MAG: YvcK family protein [Candidatus Gastranaerophilales bacterium]|nr:YvcK family protein [Candidatus Gastranaerophilales bacterium]